MAAHEDRISPGPIGRSGPIGCLARGARRLARGVLDLVYPPVCLDCGGVLEDEVASLQLCGACIRRVVYLPTQSCPRCAAAIATSTDAAHGCALCRNVPFEFDRVLALGLYEDHVRHLVLRMKLREQEPLTRAVARLFADRLGDKIESLGLQTVCCVPMHWWRRLLRGVNSAEILAEAVSRRVGATFAPRTLYRRRATVPQAELTPKQRKLNLRRALAVRRPSDVEGKHVLLVDDILTTGTTCNEAARALRAAGAASITVAVLARAGVRLHEGRGGNSRALP